MGTIEQCTEEYEQENEEINKYLTEAMGECWHDWKNLPKIRSAQCVKCTTLFHRAQINDFFTWQGFGKLWEWATKQEWWNYFQDMVIGDTDVYENDEFTEYVDVNFINPTNFANAIYKYLKEKG